MPVDWNAVNKALSPIKDYEDMSRRLQGSFAFSFVRDAFNFSIPEIVAYTRQLLGGDSRHRYTDYETWLTNTLTQLGQAGVGNILDLVTKVTTREQFEIFTGQSGISAPDVAGVLKYLIFWVIPMEKYLSGLVGDDPVARDAIKTLGGSGIRTNLQLLQQGMTTTGRKALADSSGLPEAVILKLVNMADFSRMPWASKATIANMLGAGYGSLAQLVNADPDQLYADFSQYGKAIGKNLKFGNEIESSYRIAKIVPALLQKR